jgi:hypothetical protein
MISQQQLDQISELVTHKSVIESGSVEPLRGQFPDIHFTYCMDDDVYAVQPVVKRERFNLYLVDSREHCLNLTQDREIATGIVVAEVEPEED